MKYLNLYAEELKKGDIIIPDAREAEDGQVVLPIETVENNGSEVTIGFAAHEGCGPWSHKMKCRSHVTVLRPQ